MQSLCSWSTSESSQCQTHPWSFNNTNNFSDSLVRKIVKIQVKTLLFHINHKCKKINETQCKILWINLVTTCIMKDEEVLHFLWLTFAFTFVHHWVMTITKMHYANNLCNVIFIGCLLGTQISQWQMQDWTDDRHSRRLTESPAPGRDWRFANDHNGPELLPLTLPSNYCAKISGIWDYSSYTDQL